MPDLTLTTHARDAIARASSSPHAAGLRIAANAETGRLKVALTDGPGDGDQVVEHDGALVFCEPAASRRLDGRTIDVRRDHRGRLEFVARGGSPSGD